MMPTWLLWFHGYDCTRQCCLQVRQLTPRDSREESDQDGRKSYPSNVRQSSLPVSLTNSLAISFSCLDWNSNVWGSVSMTWILFIIGSCRSTEMVIRPSPTDHTMFMALTLVMNVKNSKTYDKLMNKFISGYPDSHHEANSLNVV